MRRAIVSVIPPALVCTILAALGVLVFACSDDASTATASGDGGAVDVPDGALPDAPVTVDGGDEATDAGPKAPLFAFVGSGDGKIRVYAVDEGTGAWSLRKESNGGSNPSFLAFDPPRRRVVSVDEVSGGLVRSFSFDAASGGLTEIDTAPSGGGGPTHVSFDPTGRFVFVANYGGGNMSVVPIDDGGTFGATDTRTSGANSHWAGTDPAGTHVFVPALGANVVAQYAFDGGALVANGTATLPAGAGPRHLAFHPSAKWAYTINELAVTATTFDYAAATGTLTAKDTISALPTGQATGGVSGAEIVAHPSGKFVYASTRGFDAIAHFSVDAADGRLTLVANAPTGAKRPRSFGIDPEGTLLFAGNADAGHVVGFRIDPTSGALTSLGKTVDVASPTFVGLTRIP